MPSLPESEIVEKAIAGDTNAFRQIVEHYQDFALSLSCRFLGRTAEAEDVTQEVFVRLWKNLHKYRPEIKLKTWLYKIITNACLDQLRSASYQKSRASHGDEFYESAREPVTADQALVSAELRHSIIRLAEKLTPKQRAVFVLRDLEELTMEEVCEATSLTNSQAKSNLYYARLNLVTMLKDLYSEKKKESS